MTNGRPTKANSGSQIAPARCNFLSSY